MRHTHKINKSRAIRKYFVSNLAYFHGQFKQAFSAATMLSLINTYIWFGKRMKKRQIIALTLICAMLAGCEICHGSAGALLSPYAETNKNYLIQ
jgi:hypothetical protein